MVTQVGNTVGPTLFSDAFAEDASSHSGLTFAFFGGDIQVAGVTTTIADGTTVLSGTSTSIVYIDRTGTPSVKDVTISSKPDQEESIFLFIVVTDASSITSVLDLRTWMTSKVTFA